MRLVERPWKTPGRCAAVAHIDPVNTPTARWLDTDGCLPGWDQHVYLSDIAVRQAMSVLGYPTPLEHERTVDMLAAAEIMVEAQRRRIVELEGQLKAIDVLEGADFRARHKPGRKPGQRVVA